MSILDAEGAIFSLYCIVDEHSSIEVESDVLTILRELSPTIGDDVYVFATVGPEIELGDIVPTMIYREDEGATLILTREEAEKLNIKYRCPSKRITLRVFSDLESVGLLAAVSTELARINVPMNAVSGFYHDHLFVPVAKEAEAMRVLTELSANSRTRQR